MNKILYRKSKNGKVLFWKAWSEKNIVFIEHGALGGKSIINQYQTEITNAGKKNERSAEQQAIFEVDALYKEKLRKKYVESVEEMENQKFLPMLAHEANEKTKEKIIYPCIVQKKLNGLRCLAKWENEEVVLISRGNKKFNLPHIKQQLENILPKGWALDGELYYHGFSLQEITSLVKKSQSKTKKLNYYIYDLPLIRNENKVQMSRMGELEHLRKKFNTKKSNIRVVENFVAINWEEIQAFEKLFVAEGFEGAIVRYGRTLYEYGNRSYSLLKVKSFKDDEFEVVGYDVESYNINGKTATGVIWICKNKYKSPDGNYKTFNVRPIGTWEERENMLYKAEKYIGKYLTVKYFNLTPDNIPFHGIGLWFRLEEDMDKH